MYNSEKCTYLIFLFYIKILRLRFYCKRLQDFSLLKTFFTYIALRNNREYKNDLLAFFTDHAPLPRENYSYVTGRYGYTNNIFQPHIILTKYLLYIHNI